MRRALMCLQIAATVLLSASCRDACGVPRPGPALAGAPEILPASSLRKPTSFVSSAEGGKPRIDEAAQRRPTVLALFEQARVAFPPGQVLLRGFKKEKELELWAGSDEKGPLSLVATYEICAAS